jgi:hypothetical protein
MTSPPASPESITTPASWWHERRKILMSVTVDSWLAAAQRPGMT